MWRGWHQAAWAGSARMAGFMHLVQGDLAHLGLAALDVGAQQHGGRIAALALDGAQYLACSS